MSTTLYCNKCGKELDIIDENAGLKFIVHPGFGSEYDMTSVQMRMCCECFDNLIKDCVISPVKGDRV